MTLLSGISSWPRSIFVIMTLRGQRYVETWRCAFQRVILSLTFEPTQLRPCQVASKQMKSNAFQTKSDCKPPFHFDRFISTSMSNIDANNVVWRSSHKIIYLMKWFPTSSQGKIFSMRNNLMKNQIWKFKLARATCYFHSKKYSHLLSLSLLHWMTNICLLIIKDHIISFRERERLLVHLLKKRSCCELLLPKIEKFGLVVLFLNPF